MSEYVPSFQIVHTLTGHVQAEPLFASEIDALSYLSYEARGPRDWHVRVATPPMSYVESRARDFAIKRHGDQKYGANPYAVHLDAVFQVLCDFGLPEDERVAGWLHDTVEDTGATPEDIRIQFGPRVEKLVWAVSGIGKNRKERKRDAFDKMRALVGRTPPSWRLADGSPWDGRQALMSDAEGAVNLKLADRIANVESSLRDGPGLLDMYRKEMAEFEAMLGGHGLRRMWSRLRNALSFRP